MRARLLVDYNETLRKGDDVPSELVAKLVRVGLAETIADEPAFEPLPIAAEPMATDERVSVPKPKSRAKKSK